MRRSRMIYNGYRLAVIDANEARKLPEGSVLIVHRVWKDFRTNKMLREAFYRVRTQYRRTVAGPDVAIASEPDAEWPEIPVWSPPWLWLEGRMDMGYYRVEGRVDG